MALAIIGDSHGQYEKYVELTRQHEYTLQLGDFGFRYDCLDGIDPQRHKVFSGNHDNYDLFYDVPHNLGDFGITTHGGVTFFWVRGAFSIDWRYRVSFDHVHDTKSWWPEEQLSWSQMNDCLSLYEQTKPDIVISHSAPREIANKVGSPGTLQRYGFDPGTFTTSTQELLQSMLESHRPKLCIFGHFHKNWHKTINGTEFHCLPELGVRTI